MNGAHLTVLSELVHCVGSWVLLGSGTVRAVIGTAKGMVRGVGASHLMGQRFFTLCGHVFYELKWVSDAIRELSHKTPLWPAAYRTTTTFPHSMHQKKTSS